MKRRSRSSIQISLGSVLKLNRSRAPASFSIYSPTPRFISVVKIPPLPRNGRALFENKLLILFFNRDDLDGVLSLEMARNDRKFSILESRDLL